MSILDIITAIAATPKRTEKIVILEANRDNYLLKEVLRLAYDPNIRFWIKKIPTKLEFENDISNTLSLDIVLFSELGRIYNREVTGNAALGLLSHLLSVTSPDDSKLIELIIKKDLNCGISSATINKVWPNLIPEFNLIMKCHDSIEHIVYPAIAQLKCDGGRCIVHCIDKYSGDYIAYSSSGMPIELGSTFNHYVACYMQDGEYFDGELVAFDETGKPLDRKASNGIVNKAIRGTASMQELNSIRFITWDIIDLEGKIPYRGRFFELMARFKIPIEEQVQLDITHNRFEIVESIVVGSQEGVFDFYQTQINKGLEGVIVKNLDNSFWQPKRVKHQGKMKDELECDIIIKGWEPHIKNPAMLGSFVLYALDSSGKEMIFNVGSGISADMRSKNPEEYVGKVATVRFNKIVRNKKEPEKFTLYIPRIIEIREDKTEGDTVERILSLERGITQVKPSDTGLF